jgi:AraC-like DNA-binding protein
MNTRRGYAIEPSSRTFLRDVGVDEKRLLREARLPDDLLSREDVTLAPAEYYRLWNTLEAAMNVDPFPIVVATAQSVESFSPAGFAALCSPNLSTAVRRISRFKPLVAPVRLDVDESADHLELRLIWNSEDPKPPASFVVAELASFVALARLGTREQIVPVRVSAPDLGNQSHKLSEYFGLDITPGSTASIAFSTYDAKRPFLTESEALWQFFSPELRRRLQDLEGNARVADRVAAVLHEFLPSGRATISAVAERLIMSPRSLQRKLQDETTSFKQILRDVRIQLSMHYLTDSNLNATEIAYLVGFDDANSFFRAFAAWTGQTPGLVRGAELPGEYMQAQTSSTRTSSLL